MESDLLAAGEGEEAVTDNADNAPEADAEEGVELSEGEQAEESDTIDDGRPEGCPDKFWDQENGVVRTDAVLKSYAELEKKLGTAKPKVPETYEFEIPKFEDLKDDLEGIDEDTYSSTVDLMSPSCPFTGAMQKRAKEAEMSQDQWAKLAKGFIVEQTRAFKLNENHERKKLLEESGGNEKQLLSRIANLRAAIYNVYPEGSQQRAAAHQVSQTAAGIKFLEDVVSGKFSENVRSNGSSAPVPTDAAQPQRLSVADLRKIMAGEKYQSGDPATHKRVEAGFKALQSVGAL